MRMALLRAWCVAVIALAGASAAAQSSSASSRVSSSTSDSSAMQVISPTVVATWVAETTGARGTLRVLVLWRGTPGWFRRPGGSSASSSTGVDGRTRDTIVQGGVTFTFEYDDTKRIAIVAGKPVALGDRNVILVDDMDSASGPRVAGTLRIDSRMPGSAGQIGLVLRASPEIMVYLRCDARAADPVANFALDRLCLENLGVEK